MDADRVALARVILPNGHPLYDITFYQYYVAIYCGFWNFAAVQPFPMTCGAS